MRWGRLLRRSLTRLAMSPPSALPPGPGTEPPTAPPAPQLPYGVLLVHKLGRTCCPRLRVNRQFCYKSSILILTYISYMCYHLTRKPISIVKSVLHQNCSSLTPPANSHIDPRNNATWCDWAPFDGSDGDATALLGTLDSAFLFAYAIAMFISGFIAERVDLRYFLSFGMVFSGIFSYMFGIAKSYEIHSIGYFIFAQAAAGVAQTTGWPGVVTVVGKWFGKSKRGLLFGIWNSHTSIGNILGAIIAGYYVETDWSLSFIVPGIIIALGGFLIFLFMVSDPLDVGLLPPDHPVGSINTHRKDIYRRLESGNDHLSDDNDHSDTDDETQILISDQEHSACHRNPRLTSSINNDSPRSVQRNPNENSNLISIHPNTSKPSHSHSTHSNVRAVGFMGALKIPGVLEFSLCLFFAKLVSYTFLYWLPLYIKNSTSYSATSSAQLSTLFDFGGIAGGILAGIVCDYTGMPASTCVIMLSLAAPMMLIYEWFGTMSLSMNIFLLVIVGLLVNGPYALITTAISAELGTHTSLEGNSKALATVTAIIDGTGSIGAAIGPMIAALVSSTGWSRVFFMLIVCDLLALVLLLRLVTQEIKRSLRGGPVE